MFNFPSHTADCDATSPARLDLLVFQPNFFFCSDFPLIGELWPFPLAQRDMLLFIAQHFIILMLLVWFTSSYQGYYMGNTVNLGAFAAAPQFCEWLLGVKSQKFQVKSRSPPWFSTVCVVAKSHRYHLFRLYQQN